MLSELEIVDLDVVLVQTTSAKMEQYIYDTLRRVHGSNALSQLSVENDKDIHVIREVSGITPPFADKWFVTVELGKLSMKDLLSAILNSTTCFFLIKTERYKDFKFFKEVLEHHKQELRYKDFYTNYLRRRDILYIYDKYVTRENRLSGALFDYLVQGYSGDIDALFTLFESIRDGKKIESRKDIVSICGLGGLSVESFMFMLLKDMPPTERGRKQYVKKRLQAGKELGQIYGWNTLYNFTRKALSCIIDIKVLTISGVVYKSIREIPNNYDEGALLKYQRYMYEIERIPLSRLLVLMVAMTERIWRGTVEYTAFLYQYLEKIMD